MTALDMLHEVALASLIVIGPAVFWFLTWWLGMGGVR